jgi:hypothetical protein
MATIQKEQVEDPGKADYIGLLVVRDLTTYLQTSYTQYKSPSQSQAHPLVEVPGSPVKPPGPIYEAPGHEI